MTQDASKLEDQWQSQSLAAVDQFASALGDLHKSNPWPEFPLLPRAINHLMTELCDLGFTQSEIRAAFEEAVADMPRYTAGGNP